MNRSGRNGSSAARGRGTRKWGWIGEALKVTEAETGQTWSRAGLRTVAERMGAVEKDPDGYHYRFDLPKLIEWMRKQNKLARASVLLKDVAQATGRSYPGLVLILKKEGIVYVTCKGRVVIAKADASRLIRKYSRPEVLPDLPQCQGAC